MPYDFGENTIPAGGKRVKNAQVIRYMAQNHAEILAQLAKNHKDGIFKSHGRNGLKYMPQNNSSDRQHQ